MNNACHAPARQHRAFTLMEILIVVVILGILAAVVVSSVVIAVDDAEKSAFSTSTKHLATAATRYYHDTGTWLEDSSTGELPAGFAAYIDERYWGDTPIGGQWDAQYNEMGIVSAIGVHFNGTGETRDDAYMVDIDAMLDDGNLNTGSFRKLAAGRYYYVLAE
jgi:prepilin-type N-terminal cleavage/methylation domain-containing protein